MDTSDDTACLHLLDSDVSSRVGHDSITTAAQTAWKALAPLMAARPTMRLWTADAEFEYSCALTQQLPSLPAAVPLFVRGRARMLVFDLDAKKLGTGAVVADMRRILHWVNNCGGIAVVDRSTSGGMHVLVPLHRAVTVEEVRPLLRAVAARCPTFDAAPMLNAATGCITVPGSPCREGGHRRLIGTVQAAQDAFSRRCAKHFFSSLCALLASTEAPPEASAARLAPAPAVSEAFEGQDIQTATLRAAYWIHAPLPPVVDTFARTGVMSADGRWPTRSEARQSVLTHMMWRGASLADIELAVAGPWANGLGSAYLRYGRRANRILRRDWQNAQRWLVAHLNSFHSVTHKKTYNAPVAESAPHARWLAHAIWWCDLTLRAHPQRWTVAAVLQALAISAVRAGEVVNGVAVVAVGGRSLSIAAGLLAESTVWAVLRLLRDMPGAPVVLITKATGVAPDRYALTTAGILDPTPWAPGRPRVCEVHPAWAVIGYQHRRVFEVITRTSASTVREISAAARTSASATYESIAELARCGLIVRTHGSVSAGSTTLDDIAEQYRLDEERAQRIARHHEERKEWHRWLGARRDPGPRNSTPRPPAGPIVHVLDAVEELAYRHSVMSTGPPSFG